MLRYRPMRERWTDKLQFGVVFVLFIVGFLLDVLFPRYASGTMPTKREHRVWRRLRNGLARRLSSTPPRTHPKPPSPQF